MPDIRGLKIHSFSSEDPNFPAKNLVESSSTTKKWKVLNLKDTSSFVVLKLPEPQRIAAVNIGNEGSAFIEILVADSRNAGADFKELLLATSFMRESDAMNQRNMNQVKCFPTEDLVEETTKHEWDLVKIVCKQPFNRQLKYGIAFVTLQSPAVVKPVKYDSDDEKKAEKVEKKSPKSEEKVKKFGRFTMRMSSSEEENEDKNSTPFSRWKMTKSSSQSSQSSSMKRTVEAKLNDEKKDNSSKKLPKKSDDKKDEKPKDRQRFSRLIYESEDDEVNEKAEEKIKRDKVASEKSSKRSSHSHSSKPSTPKSQHSDRKSDKFSSFLVDDVDMPASSSNVKKDKPKSPSKSSPKVELKTKAKKIDYKMFEKLFDGVTFAFSGYVNPERGILRSKALEMGAKYQPDWNDRCTHLICAFTSTPKYHQVKLIAGKKIVTAKWIESCHRERKRLPWRRFALDKDEKDESESENEVHEIVDTPKVEVMEVDDNDDEIETEPEIKSSQRSFADISTDEDENSSNHIENKVFKEKTFFLNSDLTAVDRIKLKDQIVSMSGKVSSSPSNVDYIIASSSKQLPSNANSNAEILKGLWISECYELNAIIPVTRYKLVKS